MCIKIHSRLIPAGQCTYSVHVLFCISCQESNSRQIASQVKRIFWITVRGWKGMACRGRAVRKRLWWRSKRSCILSTLCTYSLNRWQQDPPSPHRQVKQFPKYRSSSVHEAGRNGWWGGDDGNLQQSWSWAQHLSTALLTALCAWSSLGSSLESTALLQLLQTNSEHILQASLSVPGRHLCECIYR